MSSPIRAQTGSTSLPAPLRGLSARGRALPGAIAGLRDRPEVLGIVAVAAVLSFWGLSRNGWANTFYSGAVRSMAGSWHDFLFASLDRAGLMTVDKPPAALWVQALSARIFGFHSLSILIPQALMGVTAAVLTWDLARRGFGRAAGFAAGITLALTPIAVAMSRHNNPDELLILCCVAALWFAVRGLQDGRTKWVVWSGVCIGLGFEAKMAVALFVVPGIFLAYLWVAPGGRGRLRALVQLLWGGLALAVVGLAWPLLVTLTPATDRPWISGTSDNSIWSLIVNYNGLGRVTGQTGTPGAFGGGGGGGASGGGAGPLRLLDASLGGQAGWLLGFALVAGVAILVVSRLRRTDARTGWLIVVGGAFLVSAVVFSDASGIFHPYYVSFLAPWTAMLVGAGVGEALADRRSGQIIGPLAVAGGAVTELVVLGNIDGSVAWGKPLVIAVCVVCAIALAIRLSGRVGVRVRTAAVAVALAALLAAPATWAADTLGHATSSTFPAGGPAGEQMGFGGFGGFGGGRAGGRPFGGLRRLPGRGGSGGGRIPGRGGSGGGRIPGGGQGGFLPPAGAPGAPGASGGGTGARRGFGGGFGGGTGAFGGGGSSSFGGAGGPFGGDSSSLTAASNYAGAHGGGAVGVESQGSAAAAIIASDADVAGLGGFSGRESSVSVAWLAMEVREGRLRWLLSESTSGGARGGAGGFGGFGGDSRQGSAKAISIAEKVGRKVTFTANGTKVIMYDLRGTAAAILVAAG